jgi:hypothetical protein
MKNKLLKAYINLGAVGHQLVILALRFKASPGK